MSIALSQRCQEKGMRASTAAKNGRREKSGGEMIFLA